MNTEVTPYLIGIAGPSCAGKTELTHHMARLLSATVVPLDCYYQDLSSLAPEERAKHNFDLPDALDHELFAIQLEALRSGEGIERPVYDFATHTRAARTEFVRPQPCVIVEGLFVLYWEAVRDRLDTKVFVDLDDKSCLERRIQRDVHERGRTPESVIRQFNETVRPMADKYIRPTVAFADVVITGDDPVEVSASAVMTHIAQNSQRVGGRGR